MKHSIIYQKGGNNNMTEELFNQIYLDLINLKTSLDKYYEDDGWGFTGSISVMLYAHAYLTPEQFAGVPSPNDIDIIVGYESSRMIPPIEETNLIINTHIKKNLNYKRVKNQMGSNLNSVTFEFENREIDVTRSKATIINLYGLPVINIDSLLGWYKDPMTGTPSPEKIQALESVKIARRIPRELPDELKFQRESVFEIARKEKEEFEKRMKGISSGEIIFGSPGRTPVPIVGTPVRTPVPVVGTPEVGTPLVGTPVGTTVRTPVPEVGTPGSVKDDEPEIPQDLIPFDLSPAIETLKPETRSSGNLRPEKKLRRLTKYKILY
jgi:hypothetical protein